MKSQKTDLNVKGAYLHMLSDALVSFGVVVAGIVIYFTHWFWLDPFLSIIIGIVIIIGTWNLLAQSLKLSMDAVPQGIDPRTVRKKILEISGVREVQHIHIWALSTTENALTAHLQVDESLNFSEIEKIKNTVKHELEHQNIRHTTLEVDFGNSCKDSAC